MPLVHYTGQFTARKVMLFDHDVVPFCANARENNLRRGIARQKFSVYVPERNSMRVLHCNSFVTLTLATKSKVSVNIKVQGTRRFLSELP
jgi:hypothetical protein